MDASTTVRSKYKLSNSSGAMTPQTSSTFTDVPNLSVTWDGDGGPVVLQLVSEGSGNDATLSATDSTGARAQCSLNVRILRDATVIANFRIESTGAADSNATLFMPATSINHFDVAQAPGSYVYKVQLSCAAGTTNASVSYAKLLVYAL